LGLDAGPGLVGGYLSLQRLYPLWKTLGRTVPGVLLVTPRARIVELFDLRDIHFRLYRRVVEIRDAIVLLKRISDPRAAELATALGRAEGLTADDLEVLVSAAQIMSALQRGPRPPRDTRRGETDHQSMDLADFDAEVQWLERLVRCYDHSNLLRRVLRRLTVEETTLAATLPP